MYKRREGFTLIELLVVIAIIAVLAAILFPIFSNAKRSAKENACLYNQKQLVTAVLSYVDDNNSRFPYGGTNNCFPHKLQPKPLGQGGKYVSWTGCVSQYISGNKAVLFCPLWNGSPESRKWPKTIDTSYWYFCGHTCSYIGNDHPDSALCGYKTSDVTAPSKKPCLTEVNAPHASPDEIDHGIVGQTQAFCDGHVKLTKGTWGVIYKLGYRNRNGL